ncbi:choice-of-anchor D domain-containing protein [Geomonas oryzae]|uniref:choice-of-anchor D domain-containing protein n=1 Tax=Geomonas oryzae TaxID=2364273 RepID=UPI0013A5C2DA|nr:choice-of-anchor D domain-containing protein [Geomonas oryzae]
MRRPVAALISLAVMSLLAALSPLPVSAQPAPGKVPVSQGPVQRINPYFSTQATLYSDNSVLERAEINGPPKPPYGYHIRATTPLPAPMQAAGVNTLPGVPAFQWVFGCSAVSASMIAGYYDRTGFPNIYTGPTGGGVVPLTEDAGWGTWTDKTGDSYPNNPLIASHMGVDGRTTLGSIDDYWISYLSGRRDPYISGRWTQHEWGDAVGDYMKTSQSAYNNVDGSTSFYYINAATPLTCADMEGYGEAKLDGTYGRKLFYEARGYTVTDCYTQMTDNVHAGGFSFAQFKAEIDAGRPVLLNLEGHSIVGLGYNDSNTVYLHDTWDSDEHTMTWGGSYSGMALWGVSIVNLASAASAPNLSVSPNPYGFGIRNLNTTTTQTFTVSNTGTAPLAVGQLSLSGAADFKVTTDNCSGTTVSPSANCSVQVSFTPTLPGPQSATLTIPSNDPDSPASVSITGEGTNLLPDLYGKWSKVSKIQKRGNYTVTGTLTTINGGTATADNVTVNVYISTDDTPSGNATLIGTYKFAGIAAGASRATSIRYSTGTTDPGTLYLKAVIDPANSVAESDESNNTAFGAIP